MFCDRTIERRIAVPVALLVVLWCGAVSGQSCNCVPEDQCVTFNGDLRLVTDDADDECPPGQVHCDDDAELGGIFPPEEPSDKPETLFCDGECIPESDPCPSRSATSSGEGLIDIRSVAGGPECPERFICCKAPAVCDGTCLPKGLCTMFAPDQRNDGCTGAGDVCCRMDRRSWMELINDINDMMAHKTVTTTTTARPVGGDRCAWTPIDAGYSIPPWLVSVWAKVEVIPGLHSDQFVCSGVLTSARYVLTLASCVHRKEARDLFVNIGDYVLSSKEALRTENNYAVEKITTHEDYSDIQQAATAAAANNAALIRLSEVPRNGDCFADLAGSSDDSGPAPSQSCYIIGWSKASLAVANGGRPQRYEIKYDRDDAQCTPGTICLEDDAVCRDPSFIGSPVVCSDATSSSSSAKRHAMLAPNCTGVSIESLEAWLAHQQRPGFVQKSQPVEPSRQYLPTAP